MANTQGSGGRVISGAFVTAVATSAATTAAKGATSSMVKGFVEKVVTPYFSGRKTKAVLIKCAKTYYRNMDLRTRFIPTIAVQGGRFALDDIYEPLELLSAEHSISYRINGYPREMFEATRCALIVDSAGMGKSTLTKYCFRRALLELKRIPILVELRRLRPGQGLLDLICADFLGERFSDSARDEFVSALSEGNFTIFLDGYDELSAEARPGASREMACLSADLQYCHFILTSRPDPALASFSEFSRYDIVDLSIEEAFSLLRRYDNNKGVADSLIAKVGRITAVHEFLKVPLLVTLLYKAFDYKAVIPLKKNIFFRQVFDALYQDHDLSKEGAFERRKRSNLDLEEFHKFVRCLGFLTFKKGAVQYSQEEFCQLVDQAISQSGLVADAGGLRTDLISAVPIFIKDGPEYRWSHKAFQDYFSAQYVFLDAQSSRDELINRMFCSANVQRYSGLLSLIYELDNGLLYDLCILPFIERMLGSSELPVVDDASVQLNFYWGLARSFRIPFDLVAEHSIKDRFEEAERIGSTIHDLKSFGAKMISHYSSGKSSFIFSSMSEDADRAELIGELRGYRPKSRVKETELAHAKMDDLPSICCLFDAARSSGNEAVRTAAISLIRTSTNELWSPTFSMIGSIRESSVARGKARNEVDIFEGIN